MNDQQLVTIKTAAHLLAISERSVRRLADKGLLKKVSLTKRMTRIVLQSIHDYVAQLIQDQQDVDALPTASVHKPVKANSRRCATKRKQNFGRTDAAIKLEALLNSK